MINGIITLTKQRQHISFIVIIILNIIIFV